MKPSFRKIVFQGGLLNNSEEFYENLNTIHEGNSNFNQ